MGLDTAKTIAKQNFFHFNLHVLYKYNLLIPWTNAACRQYRASNG